VIALPPRAGASSKLFSLVVRLTVELSFVQCDSVLTVTLREGAMEEEVTLS